MRTPSFENVAFILSQFYGFTTSFRTAPGSGYGSHHPYPGGLVTHTAANVEILKGIDQAYQTVFGYDCDYDVAVAAELLHDLAKPYVFQWQADGSSLKEYLRDYATQKLGVAASDMKRINAVRNYAGSQLSYMRLYQALTQGTRQADTLMATVLKK